MIDEVVCQRNARKLDVDIDGHCYIVKIQGQERFLFYEKADPMYAAQTGRWFVEKG